MPNRAGRRIVTFFAAAFGMAALVAGFALRAPLERAYALYQLRGMTRLQLDARDIERVPNGYVVRGLMLWTRGGAIVVSAPLARLTLAGGDISLDLDHPRFSFSPDRYRGDEPAALRAAKLRVADGSLAITAGDVPAPRVTFESIFGTLVTGSRAGVRYDVAMQLPGAGGRYAIEGHSVERNDGTNGVWRAAWLPLATLGEWLSPEAPVRPLGGWLRDVDVELGEPSHASAQLEDATAVLGAHALAALHGPLVIRGAGIGSRELLGTIDGVPLSVAGEVHDLAPGAGWLGLGSRDLRGLAKLLTAMANTPDLRSVRLEATAPGLGFGQYAYMTDHGPLAISVVAIDPAEPTLHFGTAIADDHIYSGGARTSALGVRTGAVAGVNGDYFDIGRTYQPQGMLLREGVLERGPTDRAALVIDRSKHVTFAEFRLRGELRTALGTLPITELNDWPPGDVAVITPAFGKQLPASPGRTFVALEPLGPPGSARYRVTSVAPMTQARDVAFGVAIGPLVRVQVPAVGETVEVRYGLEPGVADAVAGIGGGPILLRDGSWYEDRHAPAPAERDVRWPVIALASERDGGLLMVALDGRHPERSVGATRPEFAVVLQRLGAVDAMALDSGGSVTLVGRAVGDANVSVRNVPSDFSAERWISDALFLYSSAAAPSIVPALAAPTPIPETRPTP